ncbi:HAD family hydrolase [Sphingomonas sp. MA1305]|uniref:HAD family hydrolase n=1 Tax=Sphingomonas sp. MA1305 TaxID=2479204 RepID=UPI0018E00527|nr:HAD family hydrolase [Sphingomonas sp. MA1305]MBI0477143.1 HAD family hydrolase [Sphingomonas sp. MA1305]
MITTVRPFELATLLDRAPAGIRIVSLDCFDTLIWRATHRPQDVFAELAIAGGGIEPRTEAEKIARDLQWADQGTREVSIEQIYAQWPVFPGDGVAAELALEARHCFAFAPTVALIRRAKAAGLQVIIVSDTYLSEPQLRGLIRAAAGEDVAAMIDRIFCSSEIGASKADGMFGPVLRALNVPPAAILHVGDNLRADGIAADQADLHAVHIKQFDAETEHRLRLEAAVAALFDPATTVSRPTLQLHRPAIASRALEEPKSALGHDVFGPVLHSFSQWLQAEIAELAAASGRPVKPLFLLRDGFLPLAMFEAAGGQGAAISISRFTARRGSFVDGAAIRAYLQDEPTERTDVLATQLGLTSEEAARIGTDNDTFRAGVLAPDVVRRICSRSAAFARRMVQHVRREGRIAAGDIIMLVDLGYKGTVQDRVTPLLEEQLDVRVTGRYLLLTDHRCDPASKRGLFDARHYDHRTLKALSMQIAVVEQVATSDKGSAIDYADNGRPKHKSCLISASQRATRQAIQSGAIAFARDASAAVHRPPASADADGDRQTAMAILARLLFLPQAAEIGIFAEFQHDVNLGTDDLIAIVDPLRAQQELRRWGLSYLRNANRMFLAGELQPQGLPMSLAHLSAARLGLDLRISDVTPVTRPVEVILTQQDRQLAQQFTASLTHDGYFSLIVPVGAAQFGVAIPMGAIGRIVQIDDISFHYVADFDARRGAARPPIDAEPIHDAMEELAAGLWRCNANSLMFITPPAGRYAEPLALSIVFRPVVAADTMAGPAVTAESVAEAA